MYTYIIYTVLIHILCIYIYIILLNSYVNDLSGQLQKLPVGCCCSDMVVNNLMYAVDIVLLAPSGKGMQNYYRCCLCLWQCL